MPSPQAVARKPSRRIKGKSNKPARRNKQPVDLGDVDFDSPTPSQQSKKSGPGGRARARRINERAPKTGGAKAKAKPRPKTMMDKAVAKKVRSALRNGKTPANLAAPENAKRKQPKKTAKKAGAKKRSAAPAEAARTQKQVLRGKAPPKRTLRNEGVDSAQ